MRIVIAAFLAALLMACSGTALAHRTGGVRVEVVPDRGSPFTVIPHRTFRQDATRVVKQYLEARKGEKCRIVVRNPSARRVGVVIAVDGRNIIDGRKSSLGNSEMMYIVDPYGTANLEGWRTDEDTVHRFYFTDEPDSYTSRTFGDLSAVGVIAVAVYEEKEQQRTFSNKFRKQRDAAEAPAAPGRSKSEAAGTGFGDQHHSPVVRVEFEPEAAAAEKVLIRYEWREILCRKGLVQCQQESCTRLWDDDHYAPYPPGYGR